jgi:hypothetical protein
MLRRARQRLGLTGIVVVWLVVITGMTVCLCTQ